MKLTKIYKAIATAVIFPAFAMSLGGVTHSKEVGETANGTPVEITRPERLEIFGEVNGVVAENGGTLKVIAPTIDITSNTEDVVSAVGAP